MCDRFHNLANILFKLSAIIFFVVFTITHIFDLARTDDTQTEGTDDRSGAVRDSAVGNERTNLSVTAGNETDSAAVKPDAITKQSHAYGIDVSHYQGELLDKLQPEDSVRFVFIKATEGIGYVDPDFQSDWTQAGELGYYRGAYHFYHSNDDPTQQANDFLNALNNMLGSDSTDNLVLPPVLDVEQLSIKATISPEQLSEDVQTWLQVVESGTDMTPIVYCSPGFADQYLVDTTLSRYSLWVANWTNASEPELPKIWQSAGWWFWQQTDDEILEGTQVDGDIFNGTLYQLKSFIQKSHHHSI